MSAATDEANVLPFFSERSRKLYTVDNRAIYVPSCDFAREAEPLIYSRVSELGYGGNLLGAASELRVRYRSFMLLPQFWDVIDGRKPVRTGW